MRKYRLAPVSAVTLPLVRVPDLRVLFLLALFLLTLSAPGSNAQPCSPGTGLPPAARSDPGLSGAQSVAAQMHRQPTAASVAAAQKKVAADASGRRPGCETAEKQGGGDRGTK